MFRARLRAFVSTHVRTDQCPLVDQVRGIGLKRFGFCTSTSNLLIEPVVGEVERLRATHLLRSARPGAMPDPARWLRGEVAHKMTPFPMNTVWKGDREPTAKSSEAASDPAAFGMWCPRQCGQKIWGSAKPQPSGPRGNSWPQFWCATCRAQVRVGRARCCACELPLSTCRCTGGGREHAAHPPTLFDLS